MTLEITTNRGIIIPDTAYIPFVHLPGIFTTVCHTSFLGEIELPELRRQDDKNRQNSIDDLDPEIVEKLNRQMITLFSSANNLYKQMLDHGVVRVCDFVLLPSVHPPRCT